MFLYYSWHVVKSCSRDCELSVLRLSTSQTITQGRTCRWLVWLVSQFYINVCIRLIFQCLVMLLWWLLHVHFFTTWTNTSNLFLHFNSIFTNVDRASKIYLFGSLVSLPFLQGRETSLQVEGWLLQGWVASYSWDGYLIDLCLEKAHYPPAMTFCQRAGDKKSINLRETFMPLILHTYLHIYIIIT